MRDALRDAFRACRADPWTTVTIVVTLGVSTGLNAAVLALVYGILLRPLPYADPSRLVTLGQEIRFAEVQAWASRLQTAAAVAAYAPASHVLRGLGAPHVVKAAFVSDNFFEVLGVRGAAPISSGAAASGVFVSERTARALNLDPQSLVGRPVSVAGLTLPVLAVLPAGVAFPAEGTELWIPASAAPPVTIKGDEDARWFKLVARMKPGATVAQAAGDASRVSEEIAPGDGKQPSRVPVQPLRDSLYGDSRPLLAAYSAAAFIVLLVSCANVSTLLLGRASSREQELAVRLALGAGRLRLLGGLLAEGTLLALAGSTLGIGLAIVGTRLMSSASASGLPHLDAVAIDRPVLAMVTLVGALVSVLCTIGPALWLRRTEAASLVRAQNLRGLSARRRLSGAFVVSQIALSTLLVVSSGLLARSVVRLLAVDIGVDTSHAMAMRVMLADTMRLVRDRDALVGTLLDRVRALPGVRAAGIGSGLPPDHGEVEMAIRLVGDGRDTTHRMHLIAVSPGFLEALGARLISGRTLEARDSTLSPTDGPVVVISRSVAKGLFGWREAVGQTLPSRGLGSDTRRPLIVGVVDDVPYGGLEIGAGGALYMPWAQLPLGVVSLVVRTSGDPQVVPAIRQVLQGLDPTLAVEDVRRLDDLASHSIEARRLQTLAACGFAALTLLLATLGLTAALLRSVAERRHELAIRSALGGTPRQIRNLVLSSGGKLMIAGLAIGAAGALLTGRLLARALYGVSSSDPATLAAVGATVSVVGLLACLVPAIRASRVDPGTLLRS
jgi:predicted permease